MLALPIASTSLALPPALALSYLERATVMWRWQTATHHALFRATGTTGVTPNSEKGQPGCRCLVRTSRLSLPTVLLAATHDVLGSVLHTLVIVREDRLPDLSSTNPEVSARSSGYTPSRIQQKGSGRSPPVVNQRASAHITITRLRLDMMARVTGQHQGPVVPKF